MFKLYKKIQIKKKNKNKNVTPLLISVGSTPDLTIENKRDKTVDKRLHMVM